MVFNGGDFKNGISFSFRIPPDPPKGAAVATAVTAKIENICKKSCDTSILWFSTVGISKMGSVFLLRIPPDPPNGATVAACAAVTAKIEKTSKKIM